MNEKKLVKELIDRKWDETLSLEEYTEKYNSLSSHGQSEVSKAISDMNEEW